MNKHSFSLSSIGMTKGRAQVKLDGEDISNAVNGIGLDFTAREHPRVMLELTGMSADVAVDDAEIQLPAKTVELLQRLGWLNPEQAHAALLIRDAAVSVTTTEDDLEDAVIHLGTVFGNVGPLPTSDETPDDSAAGGVGPVIT